MVQLSYRLEAKVCPDKITTHQSTETRVVQKVYVCVSTSLHCTGEYMTLYVARIYPSRKKYIRCYCNRKIKISVVWRKFSTLWHFLPAFARLQQTVLKNRRRKSGQKMLPIVNVRNMTGAFCFSWTLDKCSRSGSTSSWYEF